MFFLEGNQRRISFIIGLLLGLCSLAVFAETSDNPDQTASVEQQGTESLNSAVNALLSESATQQPDSTTTSSENTHLYPASAATPASLGEAPGTAPSRSPVVASGSPATNISEEAFLHAVRNLMPMSPEQIRTLRYLFDRSQRAAATFPGVTPRPTSSSVVVNLSPGSTPPIIRLRAGFVTSIDFLDSTGAAWPISAFDLGNPQDFNVQWDHHGNTLLLQATSTYKSGNLAVMLRGFDTPVMVTLMPGQANVDYRVDLRVPGFGPNAQPDVSGLPGVANVKLVDFLDGVPPQAAEALQVDNVPEGIVQLWLYQGKFYLRTRMVLLSPGWLSSMSSPDGMHVYELPKVSVLLASIHGRVQQLRVKGL